ncbi:MAG: sensor histidine kinase [Treponema sp.]|nr:sensor histidine kinase [Treponema sp.]
MKFRKILFLLILSFLSINIFAKTKNYIPQSDKDARAIFNQLVENETSLQNYILSENDDYTKLDRSCWKVDVNKNVWFIIKNTTNQKYALLKLNLEKNKFSLFSPSLAQDTPASNYQILHFDISDDGILFLDLWENGYKKRKLISMNSKNPSEINILIDFHGYKNWGNLSMVYSSKTDQLYVETYGESKAIRGRMVLYDCGFYIFKRTDGVFSQKGQERVFSIPQWIITDARYAFLEQDPADYRGYLDWLYNFCDYGEKTFVYQTEDGKLLTDEDALRKYKEDNKLNDDSVELSRQLRKVSNNKILDESALSCISKFPQSYPRYAEYQPYNAWLLKTTDGVWLFVELGVQYIDSSGNANWKCAHMTPYLLEDADGNYPDVSEKPLGIMRIAASVDINCSSAQSLYGALVYKDNDSTSWFVYKNGEKYDCQSFEDAEMTAQKLADGKNVSGAKPLVAASWLLVLVFLFVLVIAESLVIFIILSKKFSQHLSIKDKKFIFRIQENERTKLSHDIHDSVVQNIRAIRLETEMLEVVPGSEAKKQKIVDEMTEVISLLRNICYNFRPAELSVQTENTELISIIDTLCQQFIARTKIPCKIQIQKDFVPPKMDTEKCTNIVRAVQEALSNIEKHSYATEVQIVIKTLVEGAGANLVIFIIDDGIGCDVAKLGRNKMHFGVRNMKERISAAGGEIEFFSTEGQGLSVQMKVPYEQ